MKRKKRSLTLLEVMIAMSIVMLCALPLLSPHVAMYREQKKLTALVEEDIAVQNWVVAFYERLLQGEPLVLEGDHYTLTEERSKGKGKKASLYQLKVKNYTYYIAVKHEEKE